MNNNKSDKDLIIEYLDGSNESLNILIRRYLQPIYNFVYTYIKDEEEAEDVVQEVFLKAWRNLKKFKKDKNFKTWIYKIAKNSSLDFLKKKKNITFSELNKNSYNNDVETFVDSIEDNDDLLPDEIYYKLELQKDIEEVLDEIPVIYGEVLNLYYINEFNFREISEILGVSINTVKSRYRRSLIILKEKIKNIT